MNQPAPITDEQLREEMIAYLDGELDADQALAIERRLAADEEFARELRRLQRSFELLDELQQAELNETFAATTVEMIAVEARRDVERRRQSAPWRKLLHIAAVAACLFVAVAAGYLITGRLLPNPNEPLLRHLSVLEHLDEYQQVESIEFLRELHASGLFDEQAASADDSAPGKEVRDAS